jgi:membrane protein
MPTKDHVRRWLADARSLDAAGPTSWIGRSIRFAMLVAGKFHRDQCFQRASALGFATLISLIPLSVLFFSFAGKLGGGEKIIEWVRTKGFEYVAPDFRQQLDDLLVQNISKSAFDQGQTGLVNVFAIAGLLFAAFGMMATAERYMNAIWEAPKKRPYLQKLMTFWVVLTVSPLFLALSLWVSEFVLHKGGWLTELQGRLPVLGAFVDYATPIFTGFLGFSALYFALPATRVRPASAAFGGLVAVTLWELARRSFFVYVARQGEVTSLYGKLAAVPLFLVWVYLNWAIVLAGAAVGFVHQHFRALLERERGSKTAPRLFSKAALALALLRRISADYAAGRPPEDVVAVAHALDVPDDALRTAAQALVAEGVLVEDARDPDRFVLGRAPESIDLPAVVERLLALDFPGELGPDAALRATHPDAPEAQMRAAWAAALATFRKPG